MSKAKRECERMQGIPDKSQADGPNIQADGQVGSQTDTQINNRGKAGDNIWRKPANVLFVTHTHRRKCEKETEIER